MKFKEVNIDTLVPYDKNARHNNPTIPLLMESIKQFGFVNPIIVDEDNVILAGHTRYEAGKRLKLKKVPVMVVEGLDEDKKKAYRLADNKLSEKSKWDISLLDAELDSLVMDMSQFGFVRHETLSRPKDLWMDKTKFNDNLRFINVSNLSPEEKRYLRKLNNTTIIFEEDDDWSEDMKDAVKRIKGTKDYDFF